MSGQRAALTLGLVAAAACATAAGPGEPDGSPQGVGLDAASTGPDAIGRPLDPDLDVPESGPFCVQVGSSSECGAIQVCRFHDSQSGRCESCDLCGNLGDPCAASDECDILFMCFRGQCTNFCQLGSSECGSVADCIDVGHATHGVCNP